MELVSGCVAFVAKLALGAAVVLYVASIEQRVSVVERLLNQLRVVSDEDPTKGVEE